MWNILLRLFVPLCMKYLTKLLFYYLVFDVYVPLS